MSIQCCKKEERMRRVIVFALFCAGLILSAGCVTTPPDGTQSRGSGGVKRPLVQLDSGIIEHVPSSTFLPPKVGEFILVSTKAFDESGEDVGIGYNMLSPVPVALTAYIYPSIDFSEEYENAKRAISVQRKDAKLVSEKNVELRYLKGACARFEFVDVFFGSRKTVNSLLYLYETGGWFVKFRITYGKDDSAAADKELETFFNNFLPPMRDRRTGRDIGQTGK
jgi:hypothetical protein